jgi:hypothetical protein
MEINLTETDLTESSPVPELVQLSVGDISLHRARILKEQGGVCAICKLVCKKFVLDHQHKRKKTNPNGPNGDGLVRGVLCDGCNRIEASIFLFLFVLFVLNTQPY